VPQYAGHLRHGRVNGNAEPRILQSKPAACLIDADEGLAFPACALAIREAIARAGEYGAAFVGVTRSHHFGVAAYHLEAVTDAGMVGLAFGNSPAAMPAWGGKRGIFGTNPIAASFPRHGKPALTIDMSLSEVARGKLMVAAKAGKPIPLGWALDKDGNPTTDAKAGMEGLMLPAGGVKGAMLAIVVELLCCALTGAAFGFEADSLFVDTGNRPHIGQAFLVIDPGALAGEDVFNERMETLVAMMLLDPDVRLPGYRRLDLAKQAETEGVEVSPVMIEQLEALAAVS
jgi:(2R)-3-sulfolactate dehydrogenase (NADP+)